MPISAAGIEVFSEAGGNLIIDLAGWYTGASAARVEDGLFVPITPQRLLDTRSGPDPLGVGRVAVPRLEPGDAGHRPGRHRLRVSAVALNVTATNSFAAGYVTAWPAGQPRPDTSSLNLNRGGQTVAGHVVMRLGEPGIGLYSYGGTDLIADVFGWYTGTPGRTRHLPPREPAAGADHVPGAAGGALDRADDPGAAGRRTAS